MSGTLTAVIEDAVTPQKIEHFYDLVMLHLQRNCAYTKVCPKHWQKIQSIILEIFFLKIIFKLVKIFL